MDGFVTIASADQGTPFVEAYGLLLASVLLGGGNGTPPRVVAVVAAQLGDGASTTALNLAMMMARTGRPTAIVDANIRHPEMHTAFKVQNSPGLAEVLTGEVELKKALVSTEIPRLSLLPSGKASVPAQALVSQPTLSELFVTMRDQFDLIVVDTPPLLKYPDTLHISKCVDGVLIVVPVQGASRRDQQDARRLLERVEAKILGTVLNRVPSREANPLAATF